MFPVLSFCSPAKQSFLNIKLKKDSRLASRVESSLISRTDSGIDLSIFGGTARPYSSYIPDETLRLRKFFYAYYCTYVL
jgi:hypothetical protein